MKATTNMTKSALLATALAASVGVLPAFAGSPITHRSIQKDHVEVRLDPGYFATDKGIAEVYNALKVEARKSCEVEDAMKSARLEFFQRRCQADLLGQLVNSTNSQALRKIHTEDLAT